MNDWVVWCGLMWSGVTIHVPMCFIALLPQQITSNYYLLIKEWHLYVFTVAFNVVLSYGVIENRSPHSDQSDLRIEYSAVVWKIDNYTGYTIEKNRGSINWINNWILLFLEKKKIQLFQRIFLPPSIFFSKCKRQVFQSNARRQLKWGLWCIAKGSTILLLY